MEEQSLHEQEREFVMPIVRDRQVLRYSDGHWATEQDVVAAEYALTIFVNDRELATVVCTPEHLRDLVLGFLASEGIVRSVGQVSELHVIQAQGVARVRTAHPVNINQEFYNKRYLASCCGKGRQSFYFFNDAQLAQKVDDPLCIGPARALALMARLDAEATVFQRTGGVHIAALCDGDGDMFIARTDIGRHNALDKIYGHVLRTGLSMAGKVVVFSGRLSSEIVLKVAKMGVGMVLAKSAPTALAIDIAEELNITAVGFVRGTAFNVYSHPWRIASS